MQLRLISKISNFNNISFQQTVILKTIKEIIPSMSSEIHSRPQDLISVKDYAEFEQYSHEVNQRNCTDILCIIIGVLFTALVMISCLAVYNHQNYIQANFPTDSDGKLCGVDYPGFMFVYFTQQADIAERVCVSKCPSARDVKLSCKATRSRGCNFNSMPGYQVQNYETVQWSDRNGHFCLPRDQSARSIIFSQSHLIDRNIFFNSADTYILCSIKSAIIALMFFLAVQFAPKLVNKYILYIGSVVLLVLVVCVFTYSTEYGKSKIVIGLVLLFFLITVGLTVWLFKSEVVANGVFLHQATLLIKEFPFILINIPFFLAILVAFEYIMILELNAIVTYSDVEFDKTQSLYWQYSKGQGVILKFLWIVQALWGLNFIKESFNFIVSTYAVLWYNNHLHTNHSCGQELQKIFFPYRLLVTKHLGSVVACSFMSAFFNVFDTIFDLARGGKINRGNSVCDNLDCFFDLVRSDAMPYIAITGNSYCNAARYCQYLCQLSSVLENSQSASRAYRIAVYSTLAGLVSIIGLYINGHISLYGIGLVFLVSYFIVNFFVQVHADAADGILIAYLQNQQMAFREMLQEKVTKSRVDFGLKHIKQIKNKRTNQIVKQLRADNLYKDQKTDRSSLS